jgi:hypothetical protein
MPVDHIRYDILAQEALRGLVRDVLADAGKKGLPGDHHFYITFDTRAEGVRLSPRLLEQYPDEMTVVIQYQFWDLKVSADTFEVGLSFGGVPERLVVPFQAITGFRDPSVQFALQFETLTEPAEAPVEAQPAPTEEKPPAAKPKSKPRTPARQPGPRASVPAAPQPKPEQAKPGGAPPAVAGDPASPHKPDDPPPDKPGAEVVRLDRFRKK